VPEGSQTASRLSTGTPSRWKWHERISAFIFAGWDPTLVRDIQQTSLSYSMPSVFQCLRNSCNVPWA
jgi:hypothetical protein